jgi:UDP-N-acetylmuramate dehydrogenase
MQWLKGLDRYLKDLGINFKEREPLAPYTTIKIGGSAERVVFPEDKEKLVKLLSFLEKEGMPFYVMGGGSNLLPADSGYEGVVIMLKSLKGIEVLSQGQTLRLRVLAGTTLNSLIRVAYEMGYCGFEFLAGVPATLGGAVRMNAGAFGKSTSLLVKRVEIYRKGKIEELEPKEGDWTYRAFRPDGVILASEIEFEKTSKDEIKRYLQEIWAKRRATQPVTEKTFGSVFKNPPCCYAGAMIESVGLKGYRIGEAKISEKHANFIVNEGRARAEDVLKLMKLAQEKVYENFRVLLEPEVKFLGLKDAELF